MLASCRGYRSVLAALFFMSFFHQQLSAQAPRSVVTSVSPSPQGATATVTAGGVGAAFHPSRVLVEFRNGNRQFLAGSRAQGFPGNPNLFLVTTPPGLSVADVVRQYQANPNVRFAEPDFEVHAIYTPGDSMWAQQWDMVTIAAPAAWSAQPVPGDAGNVIVAIVDTGVDFTHADLKANLYTAADGSHGFTCINGPCVPGGLDNMGHGTHVAGTIGAAHNNGTGIAGINALVQIVALKFLDANGSGYLSDAVYAFKQILALKNAGVNVRVSNNSWGGGGFSQALKDAMSDVEAVGVVNVCAAGNSGQNADANSMYPGAYDNAGIISVLATDSGDLGAGFTNYGLANVDIAAPGVSTLSTVPSTGCSLCDPSGYKLLSGTSMATPHVTGVVAALLHAHPGLDAYHARDVILDPGSYDAMTDARAKSTSTGGRLNFYKVITNLKGNSNSFTLNRLPTITMGANVTANAGDNVTLTATTSDPDGDSNLRTLWAKSVSSGSTWLFGWMLNNLFPSPTGSSVSFTAPSVSRAASVPYDGSVADNRGGGAHGQQIVTVNAAASGGTAPSGVLTATLTDIAVGGTVNVGFPVSDPDVGSGPLPAWDMWAAGKNGSSGWCCFTGSGSSIQFNTAGVYRIGVQAIDKQLNFSSRQTQVVRVGGATGTPPLADVSLTPANGTGVVPFSVTVDMGGSLPGSAAIQYYFINCGGGGLTAGTSASKATCSYTTPGTYWLLLQVQDANGQMDLLSAYVVATPSAGGTPPADTTPPAVSITSPTGGNVSGTVTIVANASDTGGSGLKQVEFFYGSTSLGVVTGSPFSVNWNTTGLSGGYVLTARATDNAGNSTTSLPINVTITSALPPQVDPSAIAITFSPTVGSSPLTVARRSTVTVTANVTLPNGATYKINNVEFYNNGTLAGSDNTSSYVAVWKVPSATKKYSWTVKVYDEFGRVTTSQSFVVTAQ